MAVVQREPAVARGRPTRRQAQAGAKGVLTEVGCSVDANRPAGGADAGLSAIVQGAHQQAVVPGAAVAGIGGNGVPFAR